MLRGIITTSTKSVKMSVVGYSKVDAKLCHANPVSLPNPKPNPLPNELLPIAHHAKHGTATNKTTKKYTTFFDKLDSFFAKINVNDAIVNIINRIIKYGGKLYNRSHKIKTALNVVTIVEIIVIFSLNMLASRFHIKTSILPNSHPG